MPRRLTLEERVISLAKRKQRQRDYYYANKEKNNAQSTAWAKAHPDRAKEMTREWYENNKERHKEKHKNWIKQNREKWNTYMRERNRNKK